MNVVRAFLLLSLTIFATACAKSSAPAAPDSKSPEPTSVDPKSPVKQANLCGIGSSARACSAGEVCQKLTVAKLADAEAPPRGPSFENGSCGGVAGFHCADGLECQMPQDQQYVADGMGTCVIDSKCLPTPK